MQKRSTYYSDFKFSISISRVLLNAILLNAKRSENSFKKINNLLVFIIYSLQN